MRPAAGGALFSDYYLTHRLPISAQWQRLRGDARKARTAITEIWRARGAIMRNHPNEQQTEAEFIRPVLETLGFSWIPQTPTATHFKNTPDYALFDSAPTKAAAYTNINKGDYSTAIAICEAKRWERQLGERTSDVGEGAEVPARQITRYLLQTGCPWGILTNGREWRLYTSRVPGRLDANYSYDLLRLLETGSEDDFLYFFLFFSRAALRRDASGRSVVDALLEGSIDFAAGVSDRLRDQVFPALKEIAAGLLADAIFPPEREQLDRVYDLALIVLYRILFVLFAESRGLLPLEAASYKDISLFRLTRLACEALDSRVALSSQGGSYWSTFQGLTRAISQGDNSIGIAAYNGDLFNEARYPQLAAVVIPDLYLARALDDLARVSNITDAPPRLWVDYTALGVRHLGTVYEGLLEYRLVVDDAEGPVNERLRMERRPNARKGGGSYYTPDVIVQRIVEATLEPLTAGLTQEQILNIRVVDPAMGSAHFLVAAAEYLGARAVAAAHPDNPNEIQELEAARRVAVERCVHGVDRNPLAVELAKLSLWLATAQADQPLSFLNHHLRLGNSLTGAWLSELVRASRDMRQLDLMKETLAELGNEWRNDVASIEAVLSLDRSTIAKQEALLATLDQAEANIRTALDTVTASRFRLASTEDIESAIIAALKASTRAVVSLEVREEPPHTPVLADPPLHWELAFPQVMLGADHGFDAVIMNPPWVSAWEMTNTDPSLRDFLKHAPWALSVLKRHWDLYVPFVSLACAQLLRPGGRLGVVLPNPVQREKYAEALRIALLDGRFDLVVDYGAANMFTDVSRESVVYIWENRPAQPDWSVPIDVMSIDGATRVTIPQQIWREAPEHRFRHDFTPAILSWLSAVRKRSLLLRDICYVSYGAQLSSKEKGGFKRERYLGSSDEGMQNPKRFVEGSDMEPFAVHWRGRWLDWQPEQIYGARFPELFTSPKLLIRHISGDEDTLVAAFDPALDPERALYTDHGVILAIPYQHLNGLRQGVSDEAMDLARRFDPWYLLGCICSRLVSRYYDLMFATGSLQGEFSHVYPAAAKQLPIADTPAVDRKGAPSLRTLCELFGLQPSDAEARRLLEQIGVTAGPAAAGAIANCAEQIAAVCDSLSHAGADFATWFAARYSVPWHGASGAALVAGVDDDDLYASIPGQPDVAEFSAARNALSDAIASAKALAEERTILRSALNALTELHYGLAPAL